MANFSRLHITSTPILVLGLFLLSANAMADIVERSNPNNEYTASGTDVSTVQLAANAASGDVIKVLNTESTTATFSSSLGSNAYTVRTFTIQSANENQQTIKVTAGRCYDLNTAAQNYNFTFENLFFQGSNTATYAHGKFIIQSTTDSTLSLDLTNVTFKQFKGTNSGTKNAYGGVLRSQCPVTITGDNVKFIENGSCEGGAIHVTAALTITVDNLSFEKSSSSKTQGGAIYSTGNTSITGNTISFISNTAATHAGGIRVNNGDATLTIKGNSITFDSNKASGNDGGAINANNIEIIGTGTNPVIKFEKNEAKNVAGAIVGYTKVTLTTGSFYFDKNKLTNGYTGGRSGGAIETDLLSITDANEVSFTNNVSLYKGGAINLGSASSCSGTIEAKTILFRNNSASNYGGAINGGTFAFSGSGTTASFTGNTAGTSGNDIYLIGTSGTVLSFTNSGTYSFDGGICLANEGANTVIDQAQVTIAGRTNDTTNTYQLQTVTISNGGALTANLDYINSLTGTFNVGTADTVGTLELNVSGTEPVLLDGVSIVSTNKGEVKKTGDGTLQIYTAAAGLVNAHSFVVSSGRLDMKEFFTGSLEIGEDVDGTYTEATFSPGNSVGDLTIDGTFTLHSGSTLFIEQEGSRIDTLSATTVVVESDSILDMPIDSLQPGMSTPIIQSTNAFGGDMANDAFWNGLLTSEDAYYWNLTVVNGNTVVASVDANAVPEPSTWALLVLGVVVLFLRKRR